MPTPPAQGPSVFEIADTLVLIGLREEGEEQEMLTTDVRGETCAVAFTDEQQADSVLPDDYELYQAAVADVLVQLPDEVGLVVDPEAANPVYVASRRKDEVIRAGEPFPEGAEVTIGEPDEQPSELVGCIAERADRVDGLSRVFSLVYQVTGTEPRLVLAYDAGDDLDAADEAARMVLNCAQDVDFPGRLLVLSLEDVPDEHRDWLLTNVTPVYAG